ncbi:hypothetical protein NQ314_011510 [Rhamnusium bicolor]|uniref:Uncharacterized protein n=1 Tax=Rhamnusium bicolor TaxID=1586634 RepID=A0AAV8XHY9_9CUCU|nr:hypothetical protein NQ314_011510 [Rhamnusium bicolor]
MIKSIIIMSGRVFKRKRGKRGYTNDGETKHPSHLRGKSIGLFYANRSRMRREEEDPSLLYDRCKEFIARKNRAVSI